MMGKVVEAHARHIFDYDDLHAGQYFEAHSGAAGFFMTIRTFFPNTTTPVASARLLPFINEAIAAGAVVQSQVSFLSINKALSFTDNVVATNTVLGSRLIPASVYRNPILVGQTYKELLDAGTPSYVYFIILSICVLNVAIESTAISWQEVRYALWHMLTTTKFLMILLPTLREGRATPRYPICCKPCMENSKNSRASHNYLANDIPI